ncbi:hypothetical protein GCM10018785_60660 [Streptomyces longispororuber]|uniref:Uncharacterized protein n=1 Tax=Streptomyces longispororuber TaxID=68230 RepID=A0A919A2L8_9ACTN|nr:hypothetical protein GCM10018785_60660 [Streptomyces longispororuber]
MVPSFWVRMGAPGGLRREEGQRACAQPGKGCAQGRHTSTMHPWLTDFKFCNL